MKKIELLIAFVISAMVSPLVADTAQIPDYVLTWPPVDGVMSFNQVQEESLVAVDYDSSSMASGMVFKLYLNFVNSYGYGYSKSSCLVSGVAPSRGRAFFDAPSLSGSEHVILDISTASDAPVYSDGVCEIEVLSKIPEDAFVFDTTVGGQYNYSDTTIWKIGGKTAAKRIPGPDDILWYKSYYFNSQGTLVLDANYEVSSVSVEENAAEPFSIYGKNGGETLTTKSVVCHFGYNPRLFINNGCKIKITQTLDERVELILGQDGKVGLPSGACVSLLDTGYGLVSNAISFVMAEGQTNSTIQIKGISNLDESWFDIPEGYDFSLTSSNDVYVASLMREVKSDDDKTADVYVEAETGSDTNDGRDSSRPMKSLQAAIDAAQSGETIRVGPGVYAPIAVTNKILTIEAYAGAEHTVIDAAFGLPDGAAIRSRCATLASLDDAWRSTNTVLKGFTLTNGDTRQLEWGDDGGGVLAGTLVDCVVSNNISVCGGGTYFSALIGCRITDNVAIYEGGGVADPPLIDRCYVLRNQAEWGGGIYRGAVIMNSVIAENSANDCGGGVYDYDYMVSCTITANRAPLGGGVFLESYSCFVYNSIVWGNTLTDGYTPDEWREYDADSVPFNAYYCCTRNIGGRHIGSIESDPYLIRRADGAYVVAEGSPCVNAGVPEDVDSIPRYHDYHSRLVDGCDLDGARRIQGGRIDMGAVEGCIAGIPIVTYCDGVGEIDPASVHQKGDAVAIRVIEKDAAHPVKSILVNGQDVLARTPCAEGVYTVAVTVGASPITVVARFAQATLHVSTDGSDDADGWTWMSAKRSIDAALKAAYNHDTILVRRH